MRDEQAQEMLREVERARARTLAAMDWGWLPFLVFGTVTLVSAVFYQIHDGRPLGTYWLIAGPLALVVTLVGGRRLEVSHGVVDRNEWFYASVIAGMLLVGIAIGYTGDTLASEVGWLFPIGIGLLMIAAFDRSTLVATAGGLIVALGLALLALGPADAYTWAAVGAGVILIGAGLAARGHVAGEAPGAGIAGPAS